MGSIAGCAKKLSWVFGGIILTAGFVASASGNTIVVKQNGVVSDSNYETVNLTIANDGTGHSLSLNGAIADQQVAEDLRQPDRIALEPDGRFGQIEGQLMP